MIADAGHVRTVGNLAEAVSAGMVGPHLRTARTRLKNWVGDDNYETAETEVATKRGLVGQLSDDDINSLSDIAQALLDAEAYLALNHGLPSFNMVMNDDAGVAQQGQVGETTYTFLSPGQVLNMQKMYLRNAELAAKDYIQSSDMGPGFSVAYDEDGDAI